MSKTNVKLTLASFTFTLDDERDYKVMFDLSSRKYRVIDGHSDGILIQGDIPKGQVITADYAKQLLGKFPDNH